ncbi:uncharacterized protein LOC128216480 [Mya arenaria]|uniref:uncharacterized protein LOC128216480 n=1 Tax=Mya arenaria TaxID=6604 RepID=UPI0022E91796|nr:uncharacterized protein LOC128216480 [Mya arenaria]
MLEVMSRKMLSRRQCVFIIVVLPVLIVSALMIIHHADKPIDEMFLPPRQSDGNHAVANKVVQRVNITGERKYPVKKLPKPYKCFDYIWTGTCRDTCYSFNILAKQKQRKQLQFKCEKRTQLRTQFTTKQKFVQKAEFKTPCLRKVVDWYCQDKKKVPNIVHYVWFGKAEFQFIHFLSFLSVYKIQNPCMIMIHADKLPQGKLWMYFLQICPKIVHVKRKQPKRVMSKKLTFVEHKADVAKLEALQEYGGIYVDTDQLILQPLDKFRNADATIGMDFGSLAANSLIIAKRNAVFIKYWLESYKSFGKTDGNKHSQTIPFKLARKYRKYVQVVGDVFSAPNAHKLADIYSKNAPWRHQYGMHMHLKLRQRFFDEEFTMTAIKSMNTTAGAVARFIIYGNEEVCRPKTDVHSIP